ncbi:MAG: hypothetical protein IJQ72_04210 [Bacilli bacterium]|nr:hypothetical protein [Bacilli bacterium]
MNKKTKLLIASILSIGLCASTVFIFSSNVVDLTFASRAKPDSLDCSYYFNNSEYQSIYDLNVSRLDGGTDIENVTTWGTVTDTFYNKAGSVAQQFIQSTDKNGNVGATCLYDINSAQVFPIGSVVSVTGTMTLYNGMSEMKECVVTKDYDSNPSPVESMKINGLPTRTDSDFTSYRYMGTREVSLTNVSLGEITSSRQCYATLDNSKQVLLFFNSISEQTAINNKITSIRNNGSKADVKGYVTCYSSSNTGTPSLQILIRHASDIEEVTPEKNIDYLYVTTDKTFHYMDTITMSDFTATLYYEDGTSQVISDAYITSDIDTSVLGYQTVGFAYERNGEIYTDSVQILVENTVTSIRVDNPVQYYAYNEQFISPTVYGTSYYGEYDITDEVEFSGFDPYWHSDYHSLVFVDYTNSAGKKISASYEYFVSSVSELEIVGAKTQFDLGEQFDYPQVLATYSYDSSIQVDVTNRVTFSGFDSSSAGECDVTVSYGDYNTTYTAEIIDTTPPELYEDSVYISGIGSYNTGNYGKSGDFEYYRAVKQSGYICKLIPLTRQPGCEEPLPGSLYNINAIKDIDHISLTYSTSSNTASETPRLCFGENNYDDGHISISCSSSNIDLTIDLSAYKVNYFRFESGNTTLFLKNITIYYSGLNTTHGSEFIYKTTGTNEYRIAPTTYSGTLVDGESYVDVPVEFDITHSIVLSTKRYTYYSYEYVSEHPEIASEAAVTAPVDVCNYFQAFGVSPANYGGTFGSIGDKTIPTKDEVSLLFGDDARCISKYNRTNGYATAVPYYGSSITYYELDIDTNGLYTTSNRQVGRIVAWATGFSGNDYGNGSQCVCTYTDDHYATFKEFNNFGGFLSRFKAELEVTGYVRGNPITITY